MATQVEDVSDHYPVEVTINKNGSYNMPFQLENSKLHFKPHSQMPEDHHPNSCTIDTQ
jgi:hypothetical protein